MQTNDPLSYDSLPRTRSTVSATLVTLLLISTGPFADAGGLTGTDEVGPAAAEAFKQGALTQVNEVSSRRRLTTFFVNEQNPFYGVQVNFVNVARGNLTFLNRDLVRLDRMPIVFGRVYDSSSAAGDFGPGWKLSVVEVLEREGGNLRYVDAGGSEYLLPTTGNAIRSPHSHLTGIRQARFTDVGIELDVGGLIKRFRSNGRHYQLVEVSDGLGNRIKLDFDGNRVSRISSSRGRFVEIRRDRNGRITQARDDSGREVSYEYDETGQLVAFNDVGDGRWAMTYTGRGLLTGVMDPRGAAALAAAYDGSRRANRVTVLHDSMSFRYEVSHTSVETALQQSAVFWHHASGLTRAAQDFASELTELFFDDDLRPVRLSYNGSTMAEMRYDAPGRLRSVDSYIAEEPTKSEFVHDRGGRISAVAVNGEVVARYAYDARGNVTMAHDNLGHRYYRYDTAGSVRDVSIDGVDVRVRTNEIGLITGFETARQEARLVYDTNDHVHLLRYRIDDQEFETRYEYGRLGLRTGSTYAAAEHDAIHLTYGYDAVGNLTSLVESSDGGAGSQTYSLGTRNELIRVAGSDGNVLAYEYDAAGRPIRTTLNERDAQFRYDVLGRLTDVYVDDRHVLTSDYRPMDVDEATEADGHTPITTVSAPVASAIQGSLDSIVYARSRGAPFGPIRFNATMARFVLGGQLVPAPDAMLLASLKRRSLPIAGAGHGHYAKQHASYGGSAARLNPGPLGFDKPANGLFVPSEFSSLNCYQCVSGIAVYGFPTPFMNINGASSGAVAIVGEAASVSVGLSGGAWQCMTGIFPYYGPYPGTFLHYVDFGDGASGTFVSNIVYDASFGHTYSAPGTYTVEDAAWCGYCGSVFATTQQRAVSACTQAEQSGFSASALLGRPETIANRYFMGQSDFQNNIFRFTLIASATAMQDYPEEQGIVSSQVLRWDAERTRCGQSFTSDVTYGWGPPSVNVRVTIEPAISDFGQFEANACGGLDCIRLNPNRATTTFGHEIGHLLGFEHTITPTDIMCNENCPYEGRAVQGWHIAKLIAFYRTYYD